MPTLSLDNLRASAGNVQTLVDEFVEHLRASHRAAPSAPPDWKSLDVAVEMLWRLTAVEKTIIALKKQSARANKTYLYKLCNGIKVLHDFMKLVNHTPSKARNIPIPPLDSSLF